MAGKEDIITSWFARQSRLSPERFPIGIGDDMAEVRLAPGVSVLITTDMLLDGTHFDLAKVTLEQAAFKAMNVNLSDCAAMATVPLCAVAAVALPAGFSVEQLKEVHDGIRRAGDAFDCPLVGGDITAWKSPQGRFAINITMLSRPAEGIAPVRRSGARAGDVICVTGSLGGSLEGRHMSFTPRIREALAMARTTRLHSMMDLSDGLSSDLNRICTQSGVGAVIEAAAVPVSDAARRRRDPLAAALNDGEDFELLFTLPEEGYVLLGQACDFRISRIGRIVEGSGMRIVGTDGTTTDLQPLGYDHL